jgi:stage II sporulation protein P
MFEDSVTGDLSTGIVGAGEYLAQLLREQYGYQVLHHTVSYDAESRDYAYSNALPEVEELLRDNPSIEVVIDLHRDEMPEERRLVTQLQGRATAQFMFFNGLCRTTKGEIAYLENPYLQDNLAFSFQMQAACNEYYPGIARRIYLKSYRYNMHVCPRTLLIELGAQNNTREEIWNACEVLAHVLDLVLSGQEPER